MNSLWDGGINFKTQDQDLHFLIIIRVFIFVKKCVYIFFLKKLIFLKRSVGLLKFGNIY